MSDDRNGCRFRIPPSRRLTWDLLTFHHNIPLCAHDRGMDLNKVSNARNSSRIRISWPALFVKAYALVARDFPELRQTWYCWPWAHLYQHPQSVATLTVHREVSGQPWLFWGQIRNPESLTLTEIQQSIDRFRTDEVTQVFQRQWRLAHLPTLLRRMIWWWNLNVETKKRATRLGTFFLSTLAGRGTEIQLPPSIQTGCLTYGPMDSNGRSRVTLAYDHRIMDGAMVADILQQMELVLNTDLVAELQSMNRVEVAEKSA